MYRSEFHYGVKGTIPKFEEQKKKFVELLTVMKDKEVFIGLPDFRPDKPVDIMGDEYTDIGTLLKYSEVFYTNMHAIARAIKETGKSANIVVPMIRLREEMYLWENFIETVFDYENVKRPSIGMMVETESALEFFEDYDKQDFTIIGLDNIIEELMDDCDRYSDIKFEDFKFDLIHWLRDLHQHYRSYSFKTRHIVAGHCLRDPKILMKLIKMGFKEFSIPLDYLPDVGEYIVEYKKTRGTYVGVAQERRIKKKTKARKKTRSKEKLN